MVDYSKWKNIEISDDEDDTHPNIDTPSLFRWRHQARVERMEERKKEQEEHNRKKAETLQKLKDTKEKLAKLENENNDSADLTALKKVIQDLEEEEKKIKDKEEEMVKKERLTPWNVDTIGQDGFTKTVINTKPVRRNDDAGLSDEEKEKRMKQFVKDHEKELKEFGMLRKYDDSKKFLQDHTYLVCENTANYLVIWCINLEIEEKHNLMEHVAHQCICMQYILELSKQLDVDPRACVGSFFSRIQIAEVEYKKSFDEELRAFKDRIRKRAAEKVADAVREAEEEEKEARLGPGGLDPVEVFESLPEPLQKCFEMQDIPLLQQTIASMPEEEATYHMRRCIDSGLWVPDAKNKEKEKENKETEEQQNAAGETPDPE
ncbi:PREDICTED: hsp90 co-chaperone Cdc37 [Wasmannia auropunctata]|uniref:hsp90 co-chaperone Cdc37 n=1 Tax=Wasmannia auropunctata TaxID=64793 RepID=UPI0005F03D48|nr:PREDICTED: hsp90 co-chaperone Cdc37 [Wasmannia auropunctata]XP_011692858.1 PREDICTED: hsp90 co-chaperone Cdc37 [Wasmannia auropunctata]XP_011692945.1 PREDICTED: hsp90 co-chaperone Cdc37 [Wasmannia auropunctata]XP_011693027.1 PREDICTED: hsp90 co-chaperone Cdc37 [Wasmannia auropunctata]